MGVLMIVFHCKTASCGWDGTAGTVGRTSGGAACCPACRGQVESWPVDLEREQQVLERDRESAMNAITSKRDRVLAAHRVCRDAKARQQRLEAQVAAAERWRYPQSLEVLEARGQLLKANSDVARAQLALQQAERDAGVWGQA
jgi:hypothetical protein